MSNTHTRRDFDEIFSDVYKDLKEIIQRIENLEGSDGDAGAAPFVPISGDAAYILLREEQPLGTEGGDFIAGAWQTRPLNTEVVDTDSIVSLAGNQITLDEGTYRIRASAPAFLVGAHQLRLQNITDTLTIAVGAQAYTGSVVGENDQTRSELAYYFTIVGTKVLELQHQASVTALVNGYGRAAAFDVEVYAVVELWKM